MADRDAQQAPPILPAPLQAAIDEFKRWTAEHLKAEQDKNTVEDTLYHYTDGHGLRGIIENGQIWFTDYRHLNDPSELIHGIDMAHDVARMATPGADARVQLFLKTFRDMFRHSNFEATLEFYIASFSRDGDDLGQWRAYADNGHGFAIGFSPRMFRIVDQPLPGRLPEFVGPVHYSIDDVHARHEAALGKVMSIFLNAVIANADLMEDKAIAKEFTETFVREIIAQPLIWNCLTSKHPAYKNEQEVRLVIMGTPARVAGYVKTRLRGSEIVPYIAHAMPLREPNNIGLIVVGPAAPADAERTVRTMLNSLGVDPRFPVTRSGIPYRAL